MFPVQGAFSSIQCMQLVKWSFRHWNQSFNKHSFWKDFAENHIFNVKHTIQRLKHFANTFCLSVALTMRMLSPLVSIPARPARPVICLYWLFEMKFLPTYGDLRITLKIINVFHLIIRHHVFSFNNYSLLLVKLIQW